jgi:hypothetical protein
MAAGNGIMVCHPLKNIKNGRRMPMVPSGKQPHNYGKSPFLMGKSAITGHFQ